MQPQWTLRRATPGDVFGLEALQHAAYAQNRAIIGVEPMPLQADYADVYEKYEIWLAEEKSVLMGALILEPRPDDLLVWSVATSPAARGLGLGNRLLRAAEERARDLGLAKLRLYTGEKLVSNVAWYQRSGYTIERVETLADRNLVHMMKLIA